MTMVMLFCFTQVLLFLGKVKALSFLIFNLSAFCFFVQLNILVAILWKVFFHIF